jgi:acyl-CoA thioester hydrolase
MAFRHTLETRFSDMDALGHINNAVYSTYFEEARLHMMRSLGLMRDPAQTELGWILARTEIDFRAISAWGDPLVAEIWLDSIGNSSFGLRQRIVRTSDTALIAEGRTVQVCLNYKDNKPVRIPDAWRDKLNTLKAA